MTSLKTSIELVQQSGRLFKSSSKFFYVEFDEKFFDLRECSLNQDIGRVQTRKEDFPIVIILVAFLVKMHGNEKDSSA